MANVFLLIILFLVSLAFYHYQVKKCTRLSVVAFRFGLESMAVQMIAFKNNNNNSLVVNDNEGKKRALIQNVDRLGTLNGVISGFQGMMLFLLPVPFVMYARQISNLCLTKNIPFGEALKAHSFVIFPVGLGLVIIYFLVSVFLMLLINRFYGSINHEV
ncbi:MAG: hypothetical protein JXR78_08595 [Victivallales bacterium]|nr:hypothetical protein [Victivallales bacterium]